MVDKVHGDVVNVPVPVEAKLTVPVGVVGLPFAVSFTVAVQVVGALTTTLVGEQERNVALERLITVRRKVPAAPAECVGSAP